MGMCGCHHGSGVECVRRFCDFESTTSWLGALHVRRVVDAVEKTGLFLSKESIWHMILSSKHLNPAGCL